VRQTLAAALLALFSFSLIVPLVFASDPESKLPACCRRAGKHRCVMPVAESPSGSTVQAARCSAFPGVNALPSPAGTGLP